ncbi:hypothetical protein HANVADRAFT_52244 [Hanseniaspora valbyensis NRRL Y-1626]|uniref:3-hydroxyisobutyryl-CoA hydrolase n=1 Tax=Hanseniaspora valbyensis NRRL Y-1626 TaxID=766949 RepID=A0A1B7TFI2_9ASCO|nr:hypothetical protein HANVADRAFT_52244 [Hanseniaspora valbyensis NRRL Y-1626]
MLASRNIIKRTGFTLKRSNAKFNIINSSFTSTKRYILTDASLINKNRFFEELNVINESLNGTLRVIKMNPSKGNDNLFLTTENLDLLHENLTTFLTSPVCECVIVNSVVEGETFSSGINPQELKNLVSLDQENRVRESIQFLKYPYKIASDLLNAKKPVVFVYNGKSESTINSLGNLASLKISTEYAQWSMNQLQNGLLPDLATTAILPKLTTVGGTNGQLGIYLLMTGDTLSGEDAYLSGISTHYIPYDAVDDAILRLSDCNFYKNKAYLKLEALTLNTEILNKNTKRGVVNSDAIDFLKKENYKIYNRIALEQYSSALEEFAQPVNSINRNYKYKYSKEALQVIEYGFDILNTENLNNDLVYKDIINRLSKIVAYNGGSEFNIEWNAAHKQFARETLDKLANVSDALLQIATRMIVHNSQSTDFKQVLANDQLLSAEFISNNTLLNNINNKNDEIVPGEKIMSLLKVTGNKKQNFGSAEISGFNKNMLELGLIKESELKKLLKKDGFKKLSSKDQLLERIEHLTHYGGKTSNHRYLKSLVFDRCLNQNNGNLTWKTIVEKKSTVAATPIEPVNNSDDLPAEPKIDTELDLEATLEQFEKKNDEQK